MPEVRKQPPIASDEWMREQQLRAELEAEAWRRLREQKSLLSAPARPTAAATPPAPARDPGRTGSAIFKGLIRFALAACGAFLAYLAGEDSQLGEFEVWLACGSAFLVVLAASAFNPLRAFVIFLADTMRWATIAALCVGLFWVAAAATGSAPWMR